MHSETQMWASTTLYTHLVNARFCVRQLACEHQSLPKKTRSQDLSGFSYEMHGTGQLSSHEILTRQVKGC